MNDPVVIGREDKLGAALEAVGSCMATALETTSGELMAQRTKLFDAFGRASDGIRNAGTMVRSNHAHFDSLVQQVVAEHQEGSSDHRQSTAAIGREASGLMERDLRNVEAALLLYRKLMVLVFSNLYHHMSTSLASLIEQSKTRDLLKELHDRHAEVSALAAAAATNGGAALSPAGPPPVALEMHSLLESLTSLPNYLERFRYRNTTLLEVPPPVPTRGGSEQGKKGNTVGASNSALQPRVSGQELPFIYGILMEGEETTDDGEDGGENDAGALDGAALYDRINQQRHEDMTTAKSKSPANLSPAAMEEMRKRQRCIRSLHHIVEDLQDCAVLLPKRLWSSPAKLATFYNKLPLSALLVADPDQAESPILTSSPTAAATANNSFRTPGMKPSEPIATDEHGQPILSASHQVQHYMPRYIPFRTHSWVEERGTRSKELKQQQRRVEEQEKRRHVVVHPGSGVVDQDLAKMTALREEGVPITNGGATPQHQNISKQTPAQQVTTAMENNNHTTQAPESPNASSGSKPKVLSGNNSPPQAPAVALPYPFVPPIGGKADNKKKEPSGTHTATAVAEKQDSMPPPPPAAPLGVDKELLALLDSLDTQVYKAQRAQLAMTMSQLKAPLSNLGATGTAGGGGQGGTEFVPPLTALKMTPFPQGGVGSTLTPGSGVAPTAAPATTRVGASPLGNSASSPFPTASALRSRAGFAYGGFGDDKPKEKQDVSENNGARGTANSRDLSELDKPANSTTTAVSANLATANIAAARQGATSLYQALQRGGATGGDLLKPAPGATTAAGAPVDSQVVQYDHRLTGDIDFTIGEDPHFNGGGGGGTNGTLASISTAGALSAAPSAHQLGGGSSSRSPLETTLQRQPNVSSGSSNNQPHIFTDYFNGGAGDTVEEVAHTVEVMSAQEDEHRQQNSLHKRKRGQDDDDTEKEERSLYSLSVGVQQYTSASSGASKAAGRSSGSGSVGLNHEQQGDKQKRRHPTTPGAFVVNDHDDDFRATKRKRQEGNVPHHDDTDTSSERSGQHPARPPPPQLLFQLTPEFNKVSRDELANLICSLGGKVDRSAAYNANATHLVTTDIHAHGRKEKVLSFRAARKPIVTVQFIYDSHASGGWLMGRLWEYDCNRFLRIPPLGWVQQQQKQKQQQQLAARGGAPGAFTTNGVAGGGSTLPMPFTGWNVLLLVNSKMTQPLERILRAGGCKNIVCSSAAPNNNNKKSKSRGSRRGQASSATCIQDTDSFQDARNLLIRQGRRHQEFVRDREYQQHQQRQPGLFGDVPAGLAANIMSNDGDVLDGLNRGDLPPWLVDCLVDAAPTILPRRSCTPKRPSTPLRRTNSSLAADRHQPYLVDSSTDDEDGGSTVDCSPTEAECTAEMIEEPSNEEPGSPLDATATSPTRIAADVLQRITHIIVESDNPIQDEAENIGDPANAIRCSIPLRGLLQVAPQLERRLYKAELLFYLLCSFPEEERQRCKADSTRRRADVSEVFFQDPETGLAAKMNVREVATDVQATLRIKCFDS